MYFGSYTGADSSARFCRLTQVFARVVPSISATASRFGRWAVPRRHEERKAKKVAAEDALEECQLGLSESASILQEHAVDLTTRQEHECKCEHSIDAYREGQRSAFSLATCKSKRMSIYQLSER